MQYISDKLRGLSLSLFGSGKAGGGVSKQEQETAKQVTGDLYSMYKAGKLKEVLQRTLASDVEFKMPLNLADPQSREPFVGHGREEVRKFIEGWQDLFEGGVPEVELTLVDASGAGGSAGVYVVKVSKMSWKCKKTGKSTTRHVADVMLVAAKAEEPKVVRFEEFCDTAEILRVCEE